MKADISPLFSKYILDGTQMEDTPFSALYDCLDGNGTVDVPEGPFMEIVDEYMDKVPRNGQYDDTHTEQYVQTILRTPFDRKAVDLGYPVFWTISSIDSVLLDCLFKAGHFTLQQILLMIKWDWNNAPAGNLAAFYDSTVSAGRFLTDLGVKLDRYFVEENRHSCKMSVELRSKISSKRICPDVMGGDGSDWLIYIPFSANRFQTGGSALSRLCGNGAGVEPDISDADYFADCFEVIREAVEDGVITAGIATGRGGLAVAAEKFRGRRGFTMDLGGIISACGEQDTVRILFSEIPGVLVQIRDCDYDYLDSQLTLQEITYYPIGRPSSSMHEVRIECSSRNSVTGILATLLDRASEGED